MRQLRGGVVRELASRSAPVGEAAIAARLGLPPARIAEAAAALVRDGLVEVTPSGRLRLRASTHA
jgi:Mn-dependent DtxR family transcriptional regulator